MVSKREVEAGAKAMVARGIRLLNTGQGVPDVGDDGAPYERVFVGEYLMNAPVDHGPLDDAWYDALDKEADRLGVSVESGDGDPNDIFVVRSRASARRCACAPKSAKRKTQRRK